MSEVKTEVCVFKDDTRKNLYRKKTYYTIEIQQEVLADNKDEADQKFLDGGGINYSEINTLNGSITKTITVLKPIMLIVIIQKAVLRVCR
nr:MAG: hypothetical protein CM15mV30_2110 [uncultured marine virus]